MGGGPSNVFNCRRVRDVRSDLYKGFNPWDRISEVDALRSLLAPVAVDVEVIAEADSQTVNSPEDWWAMVLGSGYRGTVDQLSTAEREQVRAANLDFIRREHIESVEANVIYAIGKKQQLTSAI
jgi:hypothetical protein